MTLMRSGVKVRLWSPRFKNQPHIHPPGLLRVVSVLSIFSIIGVLCYSVAIATTAPGSGPEPVDAAYIAVLHFALPLAIAYTISGNYRSSRILIAIYVATQYVATILGVGFLGQLGAAMSIRFIVATVIVFLLGNWLFFSPKMRFYYAKISGQPVPLDLAGREEELAGHAWLSPQKSATLEWFADNLETAVLLGFVAVVIYAFISTG